MQLIVGTPETFVSKLRDDIKLYNDSDSGETIHKYAMLRVTGVDIDFGELSRKVKDLYPKMEQDEIKCMITIRHFRGNGAYNAEDFTRKISIILQEYNKSYEGIIIADDLLLTADNVKILQNPNKEGNKASFDPNIEIVQKFQEMIIDYFATNSLEMLVDILAKHINVSLYESLGLSYLYSEMRKDRLETYSRNEYKNLLSRFKSMLSNGSVYENSRNELIIKDYAFYRLYNDITKSKITKLYQHVEIDKSFYRDAFNNIANGKLKNLFEERESEVLGKFLRILKLVDIKELFFGFFKDTIVKFVDECALTKREAFNRVYFDKEAALFCMKGGLIEAIQEFFFKLSSEKYRQKHSEVYKTNYIFSRDISYVKIICDTNICGKRTKFDRICSILRDANVFEDHHVYHSLYIETNKVYPKCAAGLCTSVYRNHFSKLVACTNEIKVSLIIKPHNDLLGRNNTQIFRCKNHLSKFGNKNCLTYANIICKSEETFVAIYKSNEQLEQNSCGCTDQLLRNILTEKIGNVLHSNVTQIADYPGAVFVYIMQNDQTHSSDKILSIVNFAAFTNILDLCFESVQLDIKFDFQNDVIMRFIDNISNYFEFVLKKSATGLQEPNNRTFEDIDIIYTKNTLKIRVMYDQNFDTKNFIGSSHTDRIRSLSLLHITAEQFCDFNIYESFRSPYISEFVEKLGIEETMFNQILSSFLCNNDNIAYINGQLKIWYDYSELEGLDIFVDFHDDGTFTFYLFEVAERHLMCNETKHLEKLFENVRKQFEFFHTAITLDNISRTTGCKVGFLRLIIFDMFYTMQSLAGQDLLRNKNFLYSECIDIILEYIYNLMTDLNSTENGCPDSLTYCCLKESIKPFEVYHTAKVIVYELLKLMERSVEMNTLQIKKNKI